MPPILPRRGRTLPSWIIAGDHGHRTNPLHVPIRRTNALWRLDPRRRRRGRGRPRPWGWGRDGSPVHGWRSRGPGRWRGVGHAVQLPVRRTGAAFTRPSTGADACVGGSPGGGAEAFGRPFARGRGGVVGRTDGLHGGGRGRREVR